MTGLTLSEEELRKVANERIDNYIDMGCFANPDQVFPALVEGFELGFKYARSLLTSEQAPEVCECPGMLHEVRFVNGLWKCLRCGKRIKEGT